MLNRCWERRCLISGNSLSKDIRVKIKNLVYLWGNQIGNVVGNETGMLSRTRSQRAFDARLRGLDIIL